MFAFEYKFFPKRGISPESFLERFWPFVGALGKGGQTTNEDSTIYGSSPVCYICICPEKDSLNPKHHHIYAKKYYQQILRMSACKPQVLLLGEIADSSRACECKNHAFFVLFTHLFDQSSPVACGKCRRPVPLYKFPAFENGAYNLILTWQEIYRDCDSLFMLSRVCEKFGYKQISELKSGLTKLGREICATLEKKMRIPVYYYLHRYYGVSEKSELKRCCPGCKGKWHLKEPVGIYDFCCKKCRLFSVIAPDLQKPSWK